jgi:hypothetical protein
MRKFLKSIGSFIIGVAFLIGIIVLPLLFIYGGVWLSEIILPWLFIIMFFVFAVDILIILPLGIFNKTKSASAVGLVISSYVYGLTLWLWALLLTYAIWGMIAVIIGLFIFGIGVVPIAILASLINGEWSVLGQIILLMFFTYGSRMLGFYFADQADKVAYEPVVLK